MSDESKKLEACGDGILLACARLYLKERHAGLPYALWTRLVALLVNNRTLARIAAAEGYRSGSGRKRPAAWRL
jgi:dsRNA-specific ribonuclease